MSQQHLAGIAAALMFAAAFAACTQDSTAPYARPQRDAVGNENAVQVETGEHRAPFGLLVFDRQNQLVLYYRWDNGFCGGVTPTEFVQSTYHDIQRVDDIWQTLDKTEGYWFYVYPWDGVTPVGCAFLRNAPRLATGRGSRMLHDNDYYPFAPFGPGPGANAYMVTLHGSLTTPAGDPVEFLGQTHGTVLPDGNTFTHWDVSLQLSPDPRQ